MPVRADAMKLVKITGWTLSWILVGMLPWLAVWDAPFFASVIYFSVLVVGWAAFHWVERWFPSRPGPVSGIAFLIGLFLLFVWLMSVMGDLIRRP